MCQCAGAVRRVEGGGRGGGGVPHHRAGPPHGLQVWLPGDALLQSPGTTQRIKSFSLFRNLIDDILGV